MFDVLLRYVLGPKFGANFGFIIIIADDTQSDVSANPIDLSIKDTRNWMLNYMLLFHSASYSTCGAERGKILAQGPISGFLVALELNCELV